MIMINQLRLIMILIIHYLFSLFDNFFRTTEFMIFMYY